MCNDCGEIKNNNCGCGTKVDLKCTFYDGNTLEPLHVLKGMTGEEIVVIINNYLKDLILELEPEPTILQNIGTGVELYKGFSQDRRHEIKTILAGEGVILTENEDTVEFKVSREFIEQYITEVELGTTTSGTQVYIGKEEGVHTFRGLVSSDASVEVNIDVNNNIDLKVGEVDISSKVDKTLVTLSAPTEDFKYVYILNEGNETRRMLAGDLGKNVANSNLTSITGAGLNLGSDWVLSTTGFKYLLQGLPNKSDDITFDKIRVQDTLGQEAWGDGNSLIINNPLDWTDEEKLLFRTRLRASTESWSMGIPEVSNVIMPILKRDATYSQSITLMGNNLFVDNVTPTSSIVMKRMKDLSGTLLPTPESYPITNYTVLQALPTRLAITEDWSVYPEGFYQFFVTHNLLTNIASGELILKDDISGVVVTPNWVAEYGTPVINGETVTLNADASRAITEHILDLNEVSQSFILMVNFNASSNSGGGISTGPTFSLDMIGDDGLVYGVVINGGGGSGLYKFNDGTPIGYMTTMNDTLIFQYSQGILKILSSNYDKAKEWVVPTFSNSPKKIRFTSAAGFGVSPSGSATANISLKTIY